MKMMRWNERMADLVGISYSRSGRTVLQINRTQFRFFDNRDWLDNKSEFYSVLLQEFV